MCVGGSYWQMNIIKMLLNTYNFQRMNMKYNFKIVIKETEEEPMSTKGNL